LRKRMDRDPQAHWLETETALHYARAAVRVGLWASERVLIDRYLPKSARLLELGCGGGRVVLGLRQAGYHEVTATDFSPVMVSLARAVLADHDEDWEHCVEQQDATALTYPEASFDHAIFAFNGLMCLPSRGHRLAALRSIRRVLRPGGIFLFTASDREKGANAAYWAKEAREADIIPGDRWHESDTSPVFIHSSTENETREELSETGFEGLECPLSSEVAPDGPVVREFAGETRFYVARKS
jgi:ubiquinone/menaquinone biosynthesis C-methylase UbiE